MKVPLAVIFLLSAAASFGQEGKPSMRLMPIPSEQPLANGDCKASYSGYLEIKGDTKPTETEIGNFIESNLRSGYVLTIYPRSKSGIFVNMECNSPTGHP